MKKIGLITFLSVLFFFAIRLNAQEINANVIVNMEQLTQEVRPYVATMENDVERYINNQQFTEMDWEGPPIPVEISIYLSGGNNGRYSAKLFVVSKRTLNIEDGSASVALQIVDTDWSFEYARNASLSYNPLRFHEFTSLLDFYMLIVIGMDLDTYGELDGIGAYEKAKNIVQLGVSAQAQGYSNYVMPGEFTRYSLVSEMTDLRYEELRKLIFAYYYDGLDQMIYDKEKGKEALRQVIGDMADYKRNKLVGPSVLMQAFFDSKYRELMQIFKAYHDESIWNDLMYLDPTHTTRYEEARD